MSTSPGLANGRSIVVWVARKVCVVPGMTLQTAKPRRLETSTTASAVQQTPVVIVLRSGGR